MSALGQVVALKLRSNFPKDNDGEDGGGSQLLKVPSHPCDGMLVVDDKSKSKKNKNESGSGGDQQDAKKTNKTKEVFEVDYVTALNSVLPEDIRVISWAPVSEKFSARFSASRLRVGLRGIGDRAGVRSGLGVDSRSRIRHLE